MSILQETTHPSDRAAVLTLRISALSHFRRKRDRLSTLHGVYVGAPQLALGLWELILGRQRGRGCLRRSLRTFPRQADHRSSRCRLLRRLVSWTPSSRNGDCRMTQHLDDRRGASPCPSTQSGSATSPSLGERKSFDSDIKSRNLCTAAAPHHESCTAHTHAMILAGCMMRAGFLQHAMRRVRPIAVSSCQQNVQGSSCISDCTF